MELTNEEQLASDINDRIVKRLTLILKEMNVVPTSICMSLDVYKDLFYSHLMYNNFPISFNSLCVVIVNELDDELGFIFDNKFMENIRLMEEYKRITKSLPPLYAYIDMYRSTREIEEDK